MARFRIRDLLRSRTLVESDRGRDLVAYHTEHFRPGSSDWLWQRRTEHGWDQIPPHVLRSWERMSNRPKEAQMARTAMTTMQAIRKVLEEATGPMKAKAIADKVIPLVPGLGGKTPAATVAAKLYTEAKKPDPWIRKTDAGFELIASKADATRASDDDSPLGDVPATVVRTGRPAKQDPKPTRRSRQRAGKA